MGSYEDAAGYEEVESRLESRREGLLWTLLPTSVAEALVGDDVDPEAVRDRRDRVAGRYATVREDGERALERAEAVVEAAREADAAHDEPVTVDGGVGGEATVASLPDDLDSTTGSLRDLRERERAYLREGEQDRLDALADRLAERAAELREHRETAADAVADRQETAEDVLSVADRWDAAVPAAASERATDPAPDLDPPEAGVEERLDELERARDWVDDLREHETAFLRRAELDELAAVVDRLESRRGVLRERRETATAAVDGAVEGARDLVDRTDDATATARETGETLAETTGAEFDAADRIEALAAARERLTGVREGWDAYLDAGATERVGDTAAAVAERVDYLEEKRAFDERVGPVAEAVDELDDVAAPYVEHRAYLTRPAREELGAAHATAAETLAGLDSGADGSGLDREALGPGDRDRLDAMAESVDAAGDVLAGDYNERFVERECEAHRDLFTDIDEAGHDLNDAQQRAVVRNGIYNKVVAAAGTGKTVALTYRVAYLVRKGVAPSRIAALTFTREAATEMEERLRDRFGITSVEVRTIHSFALKLVRERSDVEHGIADDGDRRNLIEETVRSILDGGAPRGVTPEDAADFREHYMDFLANYDRDPVEEADFQDKTDYVAERRAADYETLAGETVASRAEQVIADFLFTHQVPYQYESMAEWADTREGSPYRPDFYLPEQEVYIEHWGLDEDAEVAPWFSWDSETYRGKLRWAREEFADSDEYRLLETYDFEHEAGRLERALEHRLTGAGVELDRLDFDAFLDSTLAYNEHQGAIRDSFVDFVANARTFGVAPEEIPDRLDPDDPRQFHFGHCGRVLLAAYEDFLDRNDLLDFDGMVHRAVEAVESDPDLRERYDHLLVDEFQDVAPSQMRLVDGFVDGTDDGTRLFCVGDDWQSIYSFQGAAVSYFIDFEAQFGPPVETFLTANYRCPETVLAAGNDLIRNNEDQIAKTVEARSGRDATPRLHTLDGYRDDEYERRVGEYAAALVDGFLDEGSEPGEVMVLCRYDTAVSHVDEVKERLRARGVPYDGKTDHYRPPDMPGEHEDEFDEEAGVSVFSVHQSKGREAKHVLLLHAATGPFGFPPDDRGDDLVAPVQDVETNTVAEERRLFYVAITRATHDLHIQTRRGRRSPFVAEIDHHLEPAESLAALAPAEADDLETRATLAARVDRLFDAHPKQHQAGVLADRTGSVRFVSWEDDDPPTLADDAWYKFENLRVEEYDGDTQVVLDGASRAIELYRKRPRSGDTERAVLEGGDVSDLTGGSGAETTANGGVEASGGAGPGDGGGARPGDGGGDGASDDTSEEVTARATEAGPPPAIVGGPDVDPEYDALTLEEDPLGRGGNAVVHAATVEAGGETYDLAVKTPDQGGTLSKAVVERFIEEADTWRRLADHDHVVDVVGHGTSPLPWIAMEYIDGGTLADRLGKLPFEQAVWTARAVVRAVRHAHNAGVRHYDLKPANVLFRSVADPYWDVPKVADWGLATPALDPDGPDGFTPAYAAPEQLPGAEGEPDHRTDVFQLGICCYELFTGQHPFGGDVRNVGSGVEPPSGMADIPAALDDVLGPALAADPADRYEDVIDLRRGLGRL